MNYWINKTHANTKVRVYHTDRGCQRIKGAVREIPKEVLDTRDLDHCKFCSGEYQPHDGGTNKYQEALKKAASDD